MWQVTVVGRNEEPRTIQQSAGSWRRGGGRRARPGELNAFPYSVVGARRLASWRRGRGRVSHAVVDWRIMWLGCKVPEVGRR